jgi:hypothetical protein
MLSPPGKDDVEPEVGVPDDDDRVVTRHQAAVGIPRLEVGGHAERVLDVALLAPKPLEHVPGVVVLDAPVGRVNILVSKHLPSSSSTKTILLTT